MGRAAVDITPLRECPPYRRTWAGNGLCSIGGGPVGTSDRLLWDYVPAALPTWLFRGKRLAWRHGMNTTGHSWRGAFWSRDALSAYARGRRPPPSRGSSPQWVPTCGLIAVLEREDVLCVTTSPLVNGLVVVACYADVRPEGVDRSASRSCRGFTSWYSSTIRIRYLACSAMWRRSPWSLSRQPTARARISV